MKNGFGSRQDHMGVFELHIDEHSGNLSSEKSGTIAEIANPGVAKQMFYVFFLDLRVEIELRRA